MPSGALSNSNLATTSGTINAQTTFSYALNHVEIIDYGTTQNALYYSGYSSGQGTVNGNFINIGSIATYTDTSNTPVPTVKYTLNNYANTPPSVTSNNVNWMGKSDTAQYWLNATQPVFSGENLQLVINWGDGTSTTLTQSTYAFYATHNYASTGTYTISASLVNLPNPDTNGLSSLASSAIPSESYTITINPKPNPAPYTILNQGQSIYMNYTAVNDIVNTVSLSINGIFAQSFLENSQSGSLKYSPSQAGLTAFTAVWSFDGANFSYTITYSSAEYPLETSPYITTMYGSEPSKEYPITINSPPTGTGYYQQLITLSNPQSYGINSASSNFYVALPNNTLLYTWIQSYNSTSLSMWTKMPYGTAQVELQVLPSFENILSATGYVGMSNTTNSNRVKVFPNNIMNNMIIFSDFNGTSLNNTLFYLNGGVNYIVDNGLNVTSVSGTLAGIYSSFTSINNTEISIRGNIFQSSGIYVNFGEYNYSGSYQDSAFIQSSASNVFLQLPTGNYGTVNAYNGISEYSITKINNVKVAYNIGNEGGIAVFSIPISNIGQVSPVFSNSQTFSNTWHINWFLAVHKNSMPSVSIGTGSVFMANSTQFTKTFYSSVSNYAPNPLKQLYTYDIYDSFNSNYITLLSNASWTFEGDSGYSLAFNNVLDELTFNAVSGVGQVQATYLEPSQQIGQPSFIQLSLTANGQAIYQGFSINVEYHTWHSSVMQYINGSATFMQLPFGSVANISVLNAWGQTVKTLRNIVIDQSSMPISISLTGLVSIISFQFVNTTASNIYISANGITQTESGYTSFYASNQTTYDYEASIYDPSLGKNVNYSGTFTTDSPNKIVYLNATAPLAEIQINANAYAGSQVGQLSSSGPDMVLMTINGIPSDLGASYVGFMGQSLAVRIYTVLNQTLYSGNILLNLPILSDTINIQVPSWNFELKNNEQVYNKTSPLANEIINLTYLGSAGNYSYHTSDMVGNVLSIYLASGNYHIHLHDNATFSRNFSVSNDTFFIIFGQNLLTESQFASTIAKLYGNSVGLIVLPVNAPSNMIEGQKTILQFQAYFSNHTIVGSNYLKAFLANATISISNSTYYSLLFGSVINGVISINLTAPPPSSYTISITGGFDYGGTTMGGSYSYPLVVQSSSSDAGLHLYISGATTIQLNNSYTYYLQFEYSNGSALSSTASTSLLKNITVTPTETISTISPGDYTITVKPTSTGTLTILVSGYFKQNGYNLSASSFYPVEVTSQTSNLIVIPIDTPTSTLINSQTTYLFKIAFVNGTLLSTSQLSSIIANSSLTLENSAVVPSTIQLYKSTIYINFTLPDTGYYTLTWTSEMTKLGTTYTLIYSNSIQAFGKISIGMYIIMSSITAQQNTLLKYSVFLYYSNHTKMNLTDTEKIFGNIVLYIYDGNKEISAIAPSSYATGLITFIFKTPSDGSYSMIAYVSSTVLPTGTVAASDSASLITQTNALNSNPAVNMMDSIFIAIAQNFLETVLATAGIFIGAYLLNALRKKLLGDKKTAADIENGLLTQAINKMQTPVANKEGLIKNFASLDYAQQNAFLIANNEVLRNKSFMVKIGNRNIRMDKARRYVNKVNQHPDAIKIMDYIKRKKVSKNEE
uniref:AMDV4_2 n=1 Tax=uncultured virus TaxID=340016 RepID=B3GAM3_9VIRU|nr:AMDV4_2 [uncultured virus]